MWMARLFFNFWPAKLDYRFITSGKIFKNPDYSDSFVVIFSQTHTEEQSLQEEIVTCLRWPLLLYWPFSFAGPLRH